MAESLYTGITVQGLYSDQTGDQLFGVLGTTAPASALFVAGLNSATGFMQALSVTANGFLNVNASITPPSDNTATGSITSTQAVTVTTSGTSAAMIQVTGTWTGTLNVQASIDGTTFESILVYPVLPDGSPAVSSITANGFWTIYCGGFQKLQVVGNTVATGSAAVYITAGQGQYGVQAVQPVAANLNATIVGTKTNNAAGSNGTNVAVLPAIATTAAPTYTTGNVVALSTDTAGSLRVSQQGTVTVTGTVSATQGTTPWVDNLTQVAGVALGATAVTAFGTPPAAANVPGTNSSIYAGTTGLTATGSSLNVNVTGSSGNTTVVGTLTNNNAAPTTTNVGVLPAIAETAYTTVTYTTGNQVLPVTDLHGALNQDLQAVAGVALGATAVTNFGTAPAATAVPGVNASIYAGTTGITATGSSLNVDVTNTVTVTGTVAVTQSTSPWVVAGNLTNNNAAPTTNNVGVLPAIAVAGTFPAVTTPTYTAGDQELATVSQGGSLVTIPADEEYASHVSYYSVDTGATLKTVPSATVYPLVSIQSNSASIQFLIREVQGFTDGSQELFQLIKNPQTLTGSAFTATGIPTGSHIKIDTTATAVTIGTGTVVWSGFGATNPVSIQSLLVALAAGAPGDTFTMACQKFGTGTSKAGAQIFWSEVAAAI